MQKLYQIKLNVKINNAKLVYLSRDNLHRIDVFVIKKKCKNNIGEYLYSTSVKFGEKNVHNSKQFSRKS